MARYFKISSIALFEKFSKPLSCLKVIPNKRTDSTNYNLKSCDSGIWIEERNKLFSISFISIANYILFKVDPQNPSTELELKKSLTS